MARHFDRELQKIQNLILSQFAIVEKMIDDSVRALVDHRIDLANDVIQTDLDVNNQEVIIEEECLKILALHQPVARNLRRVTTVLKINSDLERIADLACNVAERALALNEFPYFPIPDLLPQMATDAVEMVRESINAYVELDTAIAQKVIAADQKVDIANREVIKELRELMIQDSNQVIPALQCFSASRHLERIGDHAENIAEDVIYMVSGEIIRHQHDQLSEEVEN